MLARARGRFTSPDEFKGGFLDAFSGQAAFQPGPLPYADIGDPQTLNKYAYVRNSPLRYTDPNGHCLWDLCIGEGAALYAAGAATLGAAAYLSTPQGKAAANAAIEGAGLLINKAADKVISVFKKSDSGATQPKDVTPAASPTNTNPYAGPVAAPVTVVDPKGNAIPVGAGQSLTGSKDGQWTQVRGTDGAQTGTRIDGGHPASTHSDPRAQVPHAHVPGTTNPDGTPWLPVNK